MSCAAPSYISALERPDPEAERAAPERVRDRTAEPSRAGTREGPQRTAQGQGRART